MPMQQMILDIGLPGGPSLSNYFAGPNLAAVEHLSLWVADPNRSGLRSPVPIYLWGDSGSGKTHLLKAAREALREQGARAGWLDASIQLPGAFDESWSAIFLDDVHLYNSQQQQNAFNWFVHAQTVQRPVIATGAVAPLALPLRDDLRSRMGWGHIFQLQVLTETEQRAVLRKAADARGVFLGDEVMDYMLSRFSRDLGHLMELLELLDGYSLQTKRPITIPLIRSMLENQ